MNHEKRRRSIRISSTSLRAMALLGAASASVALSRHSQAQTWNNPNTGSWSVGGNWIGSVAPVSNVATQLTFNATGSQTYSAFNNIANPFTLNRMTFGNSGTGLITINGQAIAFGGSSPGFVQSGSGAVTLTNAITFPTTGSTIDTTTLTGSGASAVNLNGALSSSVAPTANNGALLRNDNPNALLNLGGSGNLFGLAASFGSINVTAGTQTNIVAASGTSDSSTSTLSVTGATAQITTRELDGGLGLASTGNISVSGGGKILVNQGNSFIASAQSISGDFLGSFSTTNVTGTNSAITITGNGFSDSTGILLFAQGDVGATGGGTLNLTAGGKLSTVAAFFGERDGVATFNISGAGSQFTNTDQFVMESTAASRLNISSAGNWTSSGEIYTSSNPGDNVAMTISGSNSLADWSASPFAVLSGGLGIPAGNTTISISAGGELRSNLTFAAENQNSRADISVDGANSKFTIVGSGGLVDNQMVMGDDQGTVATLTATNGGRTTIGAGGALIMTTASTAVATASFSGAGTSFDASAAGAQLLVGGSGTTASGTASFSVTNNAVANVNNLTFAYTRGTINIGAGTTPATFTSGQTSVNGTVNFNSGTFNTTGTLSVGGSVLLSSAARNGAGTPANKKLLEAGTLSLTASGVVDLNDNDALLHSTSLVSVQNKIRDARNGGLWNAAGITSTAAKNATPKNTSLGAISGTDFHAAQGGAATFDNRVVANGDTLVKYTYYGDTDLNGVVNFDDYARTDNGFNNNRTGWFNGDFDYNGIVNFDDYSLIDLAFNTQGAVVLASGTGERAGPGQRQIVPAQFDGLEPVEASLAGNTSRHIAGDVQLSAGNSAYAGQPLSRAVPEPALIGYGVLAVATASVRRQRRSKAL